MNMQKSVCLFIWLFSFCLVFAQSTNFIKGKVFDAASKAPVNNCSVFINSTSKGTVTNNSGEFILQNLPGGKHELIISSIGYQTFVYEFNSTQLPLDLNVTLNQKSTELSEITIEPEVKDGWRVWGKTFLDNFIGTTENASHCTIKNTKALHFRFSEKRNRLTVFADEPLIIENKSLGYTIKYQLEDFYCDFHTHMILFLGFPLFTEMETEKKKQEMKWEEKRREVYLGSIIHFMKSLYNNQLAEQGFRIIRNFRIPNMEKKRVQDLYLGNIQTADTFQIGKNGTPLQVNQKRNFPKDSIIYYESVLRKPDFSVGYKAVIPDSLITANSDATKSLFFSDSLTILYTGPDKKRDQSWVFLITPQPIIVYSNGLYSPPQEFVTNGYWSLFEKMANAVPVDYQEK